MSEPKDYVKIAKSIFPPDSDGNLYGAWDYSKITDTFGGAVITVEDNDYQGDTRILFESFEKFGYLNFGWGSCSGCDALQGVRGYEDLAELIKELEQSIRWDSRQGLLDYFKTHDWAGDYGWREEKQRQFVKAVIAYLEPAPEAEGK